LSFYFGKKLPIVEHYKNNIKKQVPILYTGLITSPGSITFQPNIPLEGFVIAFLPHGFSDLFQIDVSVFTDQLPDFTCLFETESKMLYKQLGIAKDFESKSQVITNYLLSKLPHADNSSQVMEAIRKIIETKGRVDVKELAYAANMSWKTLERHFRTRVGVTPKMYARFKRFHHALSLLNEPSPRSWLEIAEICGYYDQAHFIKEFRKFTHQNPSAFHVKDYPLFYRFIIEKK
ncbi:MAG TPA: helix-turn-helix domain-containing protein, partial [Chitinophagaceae bacterium]|nr:helix-turn-helix domain-containing protein [Chitinophagaceae bacterium]